MHNEWQKSDLSSRGLFEILWVVRRRRRSVRSLGASLPDLATHFIASFCPDDYLALYEGHRDGHDPTSPREHRGIRSYEFSIPSSTIGGAPTSLKIEMFIESNYMARLMPYEFLRSPKLGASRPESHALTSATVFSVISSCTSRTPRNRFIISMAFARLQIL